MRSRLSSDIVLEKSNMICIEDILTHTGCYSSEMLSLAATSASSSRR